MSMNQSLYALVIDDSIRLVNVRFEEHDACRVYTYKSTIKGLKINDRVVTAPNSFKALGSIGRVVDINVTPNFHDNINYRWLVQKVDYKEYDDAIYKEDVLTDRLVDAQRLQAKQAAMQALGLDEDGLLKITEQVDELVDHNKVIDAEIEDKI